MRAKIYLLTAENCSKCIAMKALLRTALADISLDKVDYTELDALSDAGVEVAILFGADSIPSLIVNKKVFQISNGGCNVMEIKKAILDTK